MILYIHVVVSITFPRGRRGGWVVVFRLGDI